MLARKFDHIKGKLFTSPPTARLLEITCPTLSPDLHLHPTLHRKSELFAPALSYTSQFLYIPSSVARKTTLHDHSLHTFNTLSCALTAAEEECNLTFPTFLPHRRNARARTEVQTLTYILE
jgi:hypothetical protein